MTVRERINDGATGMRGSHLDLVAFARGGSVDGKGPVAGKLWYEEKGEGRNEEQ